MFYESIIYPISTSGGGGGGSSFWKDPVANSGALPLSGNNTGDARVTTNTSTIYIWDGVSWIAIGSSAPQLFVQPTAPAATSGYVWSNTTTNSLFTYDAVRAKWLGTEERKISGMRDSSTTTNIFLRQFDSVPTNLTTETIDWDATLVRIIALGNTGVLQTWTAEVYDDGILIASLNVVGADFAINNALNIDVAANSRISVRCAGSSIDRPRIDAIFKRRG